MNWDMLSMSTLSLLLVSSESAVTEPRRTQKEDLGCCFFFMILYDINQIGPPYFAMVYIEFFEYF